MSPTIPFTACGALPSGRALVTGPRRLALAADAPSRAALPPDEDSELHGASAIELGIVEIQATSTAPDSNRRV